MKYEIEKNFNDFNDFLAENHILKKENLYQILVQQ
jgi:hypothetical protein